MTAFPRDDYAPLEPYAPDRRPVPVDLSDNTNLWGPHPAARTVLRAPPDDALTRYPSVYADALREAVAGKYDVPRDAVTTGCGSDDLLDSAFRAATAPGGRVVHPEPTFSMISTFARMNGLDAESVRWSEVRNDPERLLEPGADLIYVCSPNNPTGAAVTETWVKGLLEAGGPDGPVVILDEAYADFSGRSCLRLAPGTDRLLVLRTFSKAYGLAGLRVGFAVGPPEVVAEVEKSRGPYKVGRLDEAAAVRALDDPAGWVGGVVDKTLANRSRLVGALEERGYRPLPSRANFVLVPVTEPGAVEFSARMRALGVGVRPFPELPDVGDAVRVTVGPWRLMDRFLRALDSLREEPGPDEPDTEEPVDAGSAAARESDR